MRNKVLLVCALAVMPVVAMAGSGSGKILKIMPGATNSTVIFSTENHIDKPACSTQANDWALSTATEGGRAMYAALLSAASMGKPVTVLGTNACGAWADREAPQWILFAP